MPYIKQELRDIVDDHISLLGAAIWRAEAKDAGPVRCLVEDVPEVIDGIMNYVITSLLLETYALRDRPGYAKFNRALGTLHRVDVEMSRRYLAPYEDGKKKENGDI